MTSYKTDTKPSPSPETQQPAKQDGCIDAAKTKKTKDKVESQSGLPQQPEDQKVETPFLSGLSDR